jgi:hypothetical protein
MQALSAIEWMKVEENIAHASHETVYILDDFDMLTVWAHYLQPSLSHCSLFELSLLCTDLIIRIGECILHFTRHSTISFQFLSLSVSLLYSCSARCYGCSILLLKRSVGWGFISTSNRKKIAFSFTGWSDLLINIINKSRNISKRTQ